MILTIFFLTITISSLMVALWAKRLGRDFWTTFFIGITLTPIVLALSLWREQYTSR